MAIEDAREQIARLLGALTEEIVLTGGGTESNNLAIYGAARAEGASGRRIVTSLFEHPSVLGPMEDLERDGFEVVRLPPTRAGLMQAEEVLRAAPEGTARERVPRAPRREEAQVQSAAPPGPARQPEE